MVYHGIAAANAILLVPLFLTAWGPAVYGKWLSLTAMITYMTLLDLGGQNYIGNILTGDYSRSLHERFREHLAEGLSFFALVSVSGFIVLAGILLVPALSIPGIEAPLSPSSRWILLLVGCSFLLLIPQGILFTIFRASGVFARGMMIGNTVRFLTLVVLVIALVLHVGPVLFAGLMFLSSIVLLVATWRLGKVYVPSIGGLRLSLNAARRGKSFIIGALFFWLLSLASTINVHGIIVIMGVFVLPASIAVYATHRTASGLIGYIGNWLLAPVWPELTFLHEGGETQRLLEMSVLAVRIVTFLSAVAAMCLWVSLPLFYPFWTGNKLVFDPLLLAVLLLQSVIAAGWNSAGWSLLASNRHRGIAIIACINAALTITVTVVLAPRYGIVGVVVASFLADLVSSAIAYPLITARFLGTHVGRIIRPMFLSILPVACTAVLITFITGGVTSLALKMIISLLAIGVSIYPLARMSLGRENVHRLFRMLGSYRVGHAGS